MFLPFFWRVVTILVNLLSKDTRWNEVLLLLTVINLILGKISS